MTSPKMRVDGHGIFSQPAGRMKTSPRVLVPLLIALGAGRLAAAPDADSLEDWQQRMQPIVPHGYVCRDTDKPLIIDGKADEAAWESASWTRDFVDIAGGPKPRFRTRAKMLWDDQYLYIFAEIEEPHVWGTLTDHDAILFFDPDFEVFIDPDGDSHEYFEFEINALNTGWDLFLPKPYKDGGKADNGWEMPGMKSAVHVRGTLNNAADLDEGWSVELALPWSAFAARANRPSPPHPGDEWRLGLSRVEWRVDAAGRKVPGTAEDNWVWSPQGVADMHRPERWGRVLFAKGFNSGDGDVFPRLDPSEPVRDALQEVYYAQRAFKKKTGHWAGTLPDLGLGAFADKTLGLPELRAAGDGWQCLLTLTLKGKAPQPWIIDADSRIRPAP
jgi:hypothetical protein